MENGFGQTVETFFLTFTSRTRRNGTLPQDIVCTTQSDQVRLGGQLVHADGMTNYQQRWGLQYNGASINFGEIVLADIKPITINKLASRAMNKR
eukprot:3068574-Amphidinium_carterae.5